MPVTDAAAAAYLRSNGLAALQALMIANGISIGTIAAQVNTNPQSADGTIKDPDTGSQVSYSTSIIIIIIITVFSIAIVAVGAILLVRRHTALPASLNTAQAPTEVFYYEPPVQGGRKPRA